MTKASTRPDEPDEPAEPAEPAESGEPGEPAESGEPDEARHLTDAGEMRALAHPVRVALLELLGREGPLTATRAGELLGESPANCSFHLRTLAKYGFVEEAPGGSGRQRPWQRVGLRTSFRLDHEEAAVSVAAQALARHFVERSRARWENWDATRHAYPKEWREANFRFDSLTYLTAEELDAVGDELLAILNRYNDRVDRDKRPPGAHPVAIVAHGHPLEPTPSGS